MITKIIKPVVELLKDIRRNKENSEQELNRLDEKIQNIRDLQCKNFHI